MKEEHSIPDRQLTQLEVDEAGIEHATNEIQGPSPNQGKVAGFRRMKQKEDLIWLSGVIVFVFGLVAIAVIFSLTE